MKRATLITVATLAAGVAFAAEPIRIGVCGPLTGDQGKQGQDMLHGVELAAAEWNARGGVLRRPVEVISGDDQHDPRQARSVAVKMVNSGVAGVIGHFNSSCTIPASDVYTENDIVMITPASTNPQVTDRGYANVFRVCGRDDQQGRVAARYATDVLKVKMVAVLHDNTTYGKGLADEFKKGLGAGVTVAYYGGIVQGDLDYKAILANVKAKSPDLWFFGGIYPEAGRLAKQAREIGLSAVLMSGDGTIDPEFLKIAGPAAEGTICTFGPDPKRLPSAKAFLATYVKQYGEAGPYSIYAYDAVNILLEGINAAKTTSGTKVAEAIRNREHHGAFGSITFDEKGDVRVSPYVCWKAEKGVFVPCDAAVSAR